jgi:hypothetical protein
MNVEMERNVRNARSVAGTSTGQWNDSQKSFAGAERSFVFDAETTLE